MNELAQNGLKFPLLQVKPDVAQLRTDDEFHKDVLRFRHIVRVRGGRVSVDVGYRQPKRTEEIHSGNLASDRVGLRHRNRIWDTRYEVEIVAHGDEESTVEPALCDLFKTDDIVRTAVYRLCSESR